MYICIPKTLVLKGFTVNYILILLIECHEYGKSAFEVTTLFSPDGEESQVKQDKCGFKVTELIVNGEKASVREFPHQALLGYGEDPDVKYLCGGSLVSEKYVLTAAHCRSWEGFVYCILNCNFEYTFTILLLFFMF